MQVSLLMAIDLIMSTALIVILRRTHPKGSDDHERQHSAADADGKYTIYISHLLRTGAKFQRAPSFYQI